MRNKFIYILCFVILLLVFTNILSTQGRESPSVYKKRVESYIKAEGYYYSLEEDLETQDAFETILKEIKDKQIFMFGNYYKAKEVNLLAAKMFVLLHKNLGYQDMLVNIDHKFQEDYDKWLETGKESSYWEPYFTEDSKKILLDYYNGLPKDKKFRILCMKNAEEDEGETFTSRETFMSAGGTDDAYRTVVEGNKLKTYVRKLLAKNPEKKYYIYVIFRETTKFSDMDFFTHEYETLGTYLQRRNPISKGKVISTVCAVRSGLVYVGDTRIAVVPNNTFNNLPFLIQNVVGYDTESYLVPLTRGFGKGSLLDRPKEGGWQIDALGPGNGAMVDVIYNNIKERWDYCFYFSIVRPWIR